jgi:FtsX-like permease family
MRLVLRRARGARSLLLAALAAMLLAASFVVGLLAYGAQVVASAARATIAAAPPEERSLLLRGAAGLGGTDLETKDRAVRDALANGVGGRRADVFVAGYGSGRALAGPVGDAVGDDDGTVFANVMFLDDLAGHARLVEGDWAQPGQATTEVTLPRAAATVLQIGVGDRVPVMDRRTEATADVLVTGIWEVTDPTEPYWLLVPGHQDGVAPGSHSYGPFTLARDDFLSSWAQDASVAWLVRPDLTGVGPTELSRVRDDIAARADELPERAGLADTGALSSRVDRLTDRLAQADLVGRSALLTPVLLVIVLGGYALLLIALLLTEHRRGETALIRARGASRPQLAGLAVREAALLVVPAVAAAPPLANALLGWVGLDAQTGSWRWAAAGAIGAVCGAAMIGPSLRRSGTYVEELGARSRPSRFAFAQRVGVDLALVGLAALAWLQLRQYASPLSGTGRALGIDPILVAAPTIGVLAGTVLSLRMLPRITALAEKLVDRRHWPAAMVGTWQAGRRPHAGPVLLLALATATSTLAWSMLSTAQRSLVDQADFSVGADLRLVEVDGIAPAERTGQVAALPGVATLAPVSRTELTIGPERTSTTVVGIDATRASEIVRSRADLGVGPEVFDELAAARPELPVLPLPDGATRIAVTMDSLVEEFEGDLGFAFPTPVLDFSASLMLLAPDGRLLRVPLGTVRSGRDALRFEVALPNEPGLALARISIQVPGISLAPIHWSLTDLQVADAGGAWGPLALAPPGGWLLVDSHGTAIDGLEASGSGLQVVRTPNGEVGRGRSFQVSRSGLDFAVIPAGRLTTVPVLATAPALNALRIEVGQMAPVSIAGAAVNLLVVAEVAAVPGTQRSPSAVIADLPSLAVAVTRQRPGAPAIAEHWVAAQAGEPSATAQAAASLVGVRVLDRVSEADAAGRDPYGVGGRTALVVAAVGALLLALIGIVVDIQATARRRVGEFAVLQTMGADSRLLARAVLAEQGFLAGLGVLVGLGVGVAVAAAVAPLLILTPSADRPEPPALLSVPWPPVLGTAAALLTVAMALSGVVAATLGRRLAVARLRIGDET